jgi:gamma-glutamyltranspeptidase/glutathione hydrolase
MDPFGAERAHIEAEAAKLAYDARNRFIADPDHTTRLAQMLSDETAAKLAALIDLDRAMPAAAPLTEAVHKDTIYITPAYSPNPSRQAVFGGFKVRGVLTPGFRAGSGDV